MDDTSEALRFIDVGQLLDADHIPADRGVYECQLEVDLPFRLMTGGRRRDSIWLEQQVWSDPSPNPTMLPG